MTNFEYAAWKLCVVPEEVLLHFMGIADMDSCLTYITRDNRHLLYRCIQSVDGASITVRTHSFKIGDQIITEPIEVYRGPIR